MPVAAARLQLLPGELLLLHTSSVAAANLQQLLPKQRQQDLQRVGHRAEQQVLLCM
jgi:hypothetical protein